MWKRESLCTLHRVNVIILPLIEIIWPSHGTQNKPLSTQLIIYQLKELMRNADLKTNGELSLKPSANHKIEIWTVSHRFSGHSLL